MRKTGLAGEIEDKVTSDFLRLMDVIEDQRYSKVSDAMMRENYRKKNVKASQDSLFTRKNFIQPA